jgi:hypothetical protein
MARLLHSAGGADGIRNSRGYDGITRYPVVRPRVLVGQCFTHDQ